MVAKRFGNLHHELVVALPKLVAFYITQRPEVVPDWREFSAEPSIQSVDVVNLLEDRCLLLRICLVAVPDVERTAYAPALEQHSFARHLHVLRKTCMQISENFKMEVENTAATPKYSMLAL